MLKATANCLVGCLALGLAISVVSRCGAHPPWATHAQLVSATVGQDNSSERRREAARWLEQSRKAIEGGNFDLAEDYIQRAERLNVQYDTLFSRFVDTPEKVRRDLERARSEGGQPDRPSSRFAPSFLSGPNRPATEEPPRDPYARTPEDALEAITNDAKSRATAALNEGRQALRDGNVPLAINAYRQAVAAGADFDSGEYAPAHLASQLRQAGVDERHLAPPPPQDALAAAPSDFERMDRSTFVPPAATAGGNPQHSVYRHQVQEDPTQLENRRGSEADLGQLALPSRAGDPAGRSPAEKKMAGQRLLLLARQAIAAGNLDNAAQAVTQAKSLDVAYQDHEDTPEKVEAVLRQARQLADGPSRPEERPAYTQRSAHFLMEQAEALLRYRDLATAEHLARQARGLDVTYRDTERTPDRLLARIAEERKKLQEMAASRSLSDGGRASGGEPQVSRLPATGGQPSEGKLAEARRLTAMARAALDRGDVTTAERLARDAEALNVPNEQFSASETQPWEILLQVGQRSRRGQYPVTQAGAVVPAGGPTHPQDRPVAQGIYRPDQDDSHNRHAAAQDATPAYPFLPGTNLDSDLLQASPGTELYQQGLRALERQQREEAMDYFRQAWRYEEELDPVTRQQLRDKLTLLRTAAIPLHGTEELAEQDAVLDDLDARQRVLQQKLYREITAEVAAARQQMQAQPRSSLQQLKTLRNRVSQSDVEPEVRKHLLTMVDRGLAEIERYVEQNQAQIELDEQNADVLRSLELDREKKLQIQDKIAELVEQFNTLLDEQRYAEAEVIAQQVHELDPRSPIAQTLSWKSRFVRRVMEQESIKAAKEQGFYSAMTSVDEASTPFDDREPYLIGDARRWDALTRNRRQWLQERSNRLGPAEQEIQRKLQEKVDVRFESMPLGEVLHTLGEMAGVPIHIDEQGLAAEGLTPSHEVTIRLSQPISLRSALNLILEELRLSYVIKDEVLKVSSEQVRESNVYPEVYQVADLVIPIPHFITGHDAGLSGALREAFRTLNYGPQAQAKGSLPMAMPMANASMPPSNSSVLAQMGQSGLIPGADTHLAGARPGGLGGATAPDFDTLIELITTTVGKGTWQEYGGPGTISENVSTLSLVISQTQDVHQEIVDLLEQLRRLQDLQVTIEVRFITLNDNFFERIGIDFDFDIDSNVRFLPPDDAGPSTVVGLGPDGTPTADFDLSFEQGSFGASVPTFGGFDAATAANFGFAILSDIEMFFLLQAAQGDDRSNVLQAPKVTMFNGTTATVSDQSQRPFVTSIIPIVGDFAAAQQPVIMVLNEGTTLNVQAVVSNDRRFVRLTLVPFFSQIGEVEEFTFDGSTTTRSGTNLVDPETGEPLGPTDNQEVIRQGTTVQQPTFSFTTVSTVVSVPDGGTVLLGGIKRLREGRTERGIPIMSKLPYINRLFRNVGIGRETNSLMMMVTPRIIIQEEEEMRQVGGEFIP